MGWPSGWGKHCPSLPSRSRHRVKCTPYFRTPNATPRSPALQCDTVKSTPQVLKDLATAEPKQVADMTDDERRVSGRAWSCL